MAVVVGVLALVASGCATGAKATATPGGSVSTTNLNVALDGKDLCTYLTADDFSAAGVTGAGRVSENNTDTEFYCVYAGKSSATGGIELDAFVYDDLDDQDAGFNSLLPVDDVQDVTAQVPGAALAEVGTESLGGPDFAGIAVRGGVKVNHDSLIYGIGIPRAGDWEMKLVALANKFMSHVEALASPNP